MMRYVRGLLLLVLVGILASPAGASNDPDRRFARTVRALPADNDDLQVDFARTSLALLVEALLAEADLARSELHDAARPEKLLSWSTGVEQYSEQLLTMLEHLDFGDLPEVRVLAEGSVVVGLGSQRVLLNHPRPAQQSAYEQLVLADFCSRRHCGELTSTEADAPIDVSESRLSIAWSFSVDGPICAARSLSLQFTPAMSLASGRMLCEQLFAELGALYAGIGREQRHGVRVDWEAVSLAPLVGREEHLVRLNPRGDSLLLPLPLLSANPSALSASLPWGRALLAGEEIDLALSTRELGWE